MSSPPVAPLLRLASAALILTLAAAGLSCSAAKSQSEGKVRAFVSILPQLYFVERVGASRVQVEALVQPGQEPHTYEPTPRQVAALAQARVYFRIGFTFENSLIPRIQSTMPNLAIVDTRQGIQLRKISEDSSAEQREDEAVQGDLDPHIWMSPRLAKQQALTIRDALIRLDPEGEAGYMANYQRFAADLDQLHQRIAKVLAPLRGKVLLVYHPAFGYFTDEYGLRQVAVETGGKEPTARQLAHLIEQARAYGTKVIFVQPQFSQARARAVAEAIGGAVVPLDDLARDYAANLMQVASRIEEALR